MKFIFSKLVLFIGICPLLLLLPEGLHYHFYVSDLGATIISFVLIAFALGMYVVSKYIENNDL
jgi:hypothetical protein